MKASGFYHTVGVRLAVLCQPDRKLMHVLKCLFVCLHGVWSQGLKWVCVFDTMTAWSIANSSAPAKFSWNLTTAGHTWNRTGNNGDNSDERWQPGLCVFLCMYPNCTKYKCITHAQLHTANLWMFKQTSACACMQKSDEHVWSWGINRRLWLVCHWKRRREAPGTVTASSQIADAKSPVFYLPILLLLIHNLVPTFVSEALLVFLMNGVPLWISIFPICKFHHTFSNLFSTEKPLHFIPI